MTLWTRPMIPLKSGRTHLAGPQADHRREPPPLGRCKRLKQEEALKQEKKPRPTNSVSSFPRSVDVVRFERINGRLKDEPPSTSPPHVRHDRADGQPADAIVPPKSGSSPSPSPQPHFLKGGAAKRARVRRKFGGSANADPTARSKSRQLPCADVVASLGVLAPLNPGSSDQDGEHCEADPADWRDLDEVI